MVEAQGQRCLAIKGDVRHAEDCRLAVERAVVELGGLNILVNNAAYQMAQKKFEDISEEQFRRTLETNIFGYFYMGRKRLSPIFRQRMRLSIRAVLWAWSVMKC